MSTLTGFGSEPRGWDDSCRWLLTGIAISVLLHGSAVAAYWWQFASKSVSAAPAAAPMAITLMMPLASPAEDQSELPPSEPQVQRTPAKRVETAASKTDDRATKTAMQERVALPVAEKPSPFRSQENPSQTALPEAIPETIPEPIADAPTETASAEPAALKPPLAEQTRVEQTKVEQTQAEPLSESPAVQEPEAREPVDTAQQAVAARAASAPPGVKVQEKAEVVSAPARGQFSRFGEQQKQTWQRRLHAHLEQHKKYPRQARRFGRQGTPVIAFTMDRNGLVLVVKLVKSSGNRSLDEEAQALVKRAEPLPKPPASLEGARLTFTVPISFSRSG
ncbi:energy transducer TonB [Photobacterium sp. 53610]|uniref:energy transducer TonB n=1 Tax=Photobacterium sp. 53610 TaxID=3102789 RepID=UPI002EDA17EA